MFSSLFYQFNVKNKMVKNKIFNIEIQQQTLLLMPV